MSLILLSVNCKKPFILNGFLLFETLNYVRILMFTLKKFGGLFTYE